MRVQFLILTLLTFSTLYAQEQIMSVHLKGGGSHSHRVAEVDSITFRSESGNTPPTVLTINSDLFKTFRSYIGMTRSQIDAEVSKLNMKIKERDETYIRADIEDVITYVIQLKNGKVHSFRGFVAYPDEKKAIDNLTDCSDALSTIAIYGGKYSAKFMNQSFTERSLFFSYLNNNKNNTGYWSARESCEVGANVSGSWTFEKSISSINISMSEEPSGVLPPEQTAYAPVSAIGKTFVIGTYTVRITGQSSCSVSLGSSSAMILTGTPTCSYTRKGDDRAELNLNITFRPAFGGMGYTSGSFRFTFNLTYDRENGGTYTGYNTYSYYGSTSLSPGSTNISGSFSMY